MISPGPERVASYFTEDTIFKGPRGVNVDAVAGAPFPCRAVVISGAAPGTTCGNHRANYPRHHRTPSGMVFAVQMHEPTRKAGRNPYPRPALQARGHWFEPSCAHQGPGGVFLRYQHEGLGQRPRLGLARRRSGRRAATVMLAPVHARVARVRTRSARYRPARRRAWRPTAARARPSRPEPRPCPCVTAVWRRWRCAAARVRSARGRACAPMPARVRAPSRAPGPCAWSRRSSAPA